MNEEEIRQYNICIGVDLQAELLPNGLVRVFDRVSKLSACYDGETGAKRHGGLPYIDLHSMMENR